MKNRYLRMAGGVVAMALVVALLPLSAGVASAAVPQPLNANTATAWSYFVGDTTLTPIQVTGLVGNLQYESGGALDANVRQGSCTGTCGVGIAQWTSPGGRFDGLKSLAARENVGWNTLMVQLHFVWQELSTSPGYGLADLKNCTTVECATAVVMKKYERPAVQTTDCNVKAQPSYCNRLADAYALKAAYENSGSTPPPPAAASVVAALPVSNGGGAYVVRSNGQIAVSGAAIFRGDASGLHLNAPIRGGALTPSGNGYWLVAGDGGIFSYGDAQFYGSIGGKPLNAPIVGLASTPSGQGYWLVAADGGLFSYGDARFYGSTGGKPLNAPVVGMGSTPSGQGYWLVAGDGGIFNYGDAGFFGSTGGLKLNAPVIGMTSSPSGQGYVLAASDSGTFAYGDGRFYGNFVGSHRVATAIAAVPDGGYQLVDTAGSVSVFSAPARIGIVANGHAYVKEGAIGAGWVDIASGVKAVSVGGSRVAVLTTSGDVYAADGPLGSVLRKIGNDVTSINVTAHRVAALGANGHLYVQAGALSPSGWVDEMGGFVESSISGTRVAAVAGSHMWVKEGALTSGWIDEFAPAVHGTISGSRIGVIDTGGTAWMKEGPVNAGWSNVGRAALSLSLAGNRMGMQSRDGTYYAGEGPLAAPGFIGEYAPSTSGVVADDRIGVLSGGGLYVKEGGLSTGWSLLWNVSLGNATGIAFSAS